MPFVSQAQRRYMHAKEPELAEEYESKTPKGKKLPERVQKAPSPMDLAWAYLLKQVPPLADWSGEDLKALRWIPDYREKTYSQPQEIRGRAKGSTQEYEQQVRDKAPSQYRRNLPGVLEGLRPRGTWVSPADVAALTAPDLTRPKSMKQTLLGITESPHWYRDANEGAMYYDEGFQYGGFSPESFVKVPLPDVPVYGQRVRTPLEMQDYAITALKEPSGPTKDALLDYFRDLGLRAQVNSNVWEQDVGSPLTLDQVIEEFPYALSGLTQYPNERIDRTMPPTLQPRRVA